MNSKLFCRCSGFQFRRLRIHVYYNGLSQIKSFVMMIELQYIIREICFKQVLLIAKPYQNSFTCDKISLHNVELSDNNIFNFKWQRSVFITSGSILFAISSFAILIEEISSCADSEKKSVARNWLENWNESLQGVISDKCLKWRQLWLDCTYDPLSRAATMGSNSFRT